MRRLWLLLSLAAALSAQVSTAPFDALVLDQDHPAIGWTKAPTDDPVARLNARLRDGSLQLHAQGQTGYLADILKALGIPASSQMLVYARSSLQADFITPSTPRALYFNDTTAVGWIPGTPLVEFAVHDARQGVVFYVMNQKAAKPQFARQTSCTMCHETQLGVPGMVLQSVPTATDGTPLFRLGDWPETDATPFTNRWGGWYVTGKHAPFSHMGNQFVADARNAGTLAPKQGPRPGVDKLAASYLSNTSDIVALLVFEHQAETMNWLTRAGWHARIAAAEGHAPEKIATIVQPTVNALVDALLFAGQAPLPTKIASANSFAEDFTAMGPKDKAGRSLRDFDLERRLFRYPLSYLIYSPAFDALPAAARAQVYARLWKVLAGQETGARYAHLTPALRHAIVEILRDTKPDLPAYFAAQSIQ